MSQQINLYYPIFRREPKKFSAIAMLQAGAIIVLGIVLIYGFNLWQIHALRAALAQAQAQHEAATKRLDDLTRQLVTSMPSKENVSALQDKVAAREQVQQLLQNGALGNTHGYSDYFVAFSKQHIPGLWLTNFDIADGGSKVTLQGRATAKELVPQYLQRLSKEKVLSGLQFRIFQVTRPVAKDKKTILPYYEFLVGTVAPDDAGKTP